MQLMVRTPFTETCVSDFFHDPPPWVGFLHRWDLSGYTLFDSPNYAGVFRSTVMPIASIDFK